MLQCKAGARPDLALEAGWDLEDEAGRHQGALARQDEQRPVFGHGGAQVHARRASGLVGGQRQAFRVGQADDDERGWHETALRAFGCS